MKHKDFHISSEERTAYIRRPMNPSNLAPDRLAVYTVGFHGHGTWREWTDWLRMRHWERR